MDESVGLGELGDTDALGESDPLGLADSDGQGDGLDGVSVGVGDGPSVEAGPGEVLAVEDVGEPAAGVADTDWLDLLNGEGRP